MNVFTKLIDYNPNKSTLFWLQLQLSIILSICEFTESFFYLGHGQHHSNHKRRATATTTKNNWTMTCTFSLPQACPDIFSLSFVLLLSLSMSLMLSLCLSVRMSVCQSVLPNLFVYLYDDCLLLCKFVRQYFSLLVFMSVLPNATSFQYKKNSKMISATFQSATIWANGRFLFVLTKSFKVTKKIKFR